jgi:hypothetical protein
MDKTYLIELFRDMPPRMWPKTQIYCNRDLKPKLLDAIGEKLNVTGKYGNINTVDISDYLFVSHTVSIILVHFISEWQLLLRISTYRILYTQTNVPSCGTKINIQRK